MTSQHDAVPSFGDAQMYDSQPALSPSSSTDSSAAASEDDSAPRPSSRALQTRPKLGSRRSSGTIIVPRDTTTTYVDDDILDEGDVRAMSPRRNSEEVDRLGEEARQDLMEQARNLQASLQAIIDRVESVKTEHEKLEGGNKFLQSYVTLDFNAELTWY